MEEGEEGGEDTQTKEEVEERDTSALYGSHGPKFGGRCEFLYSQFELHSPVAKRHQIVLLKVTTTRFIPARVMHTVHRWKRCM